MAGDMSDADVTDGFHLVVEALKLNGVDTIFGAAGDADAAKAESGFRRRGVAAIVHPAPDLLDWRHGTDA
jgi:hypothetical protein